MQQTQTAPIPPNDLGLSPAPSEARGWPFLRFLTPAVCRVLFALLLLFGAYSHVRYLNDNCPMGLSGDEAYYWEWSRNLDLSYYSKGPMVAYLIRASCAIFGDIMPAVRYPAMVLGTGTAILTYWLIVKLFRSDRLALGWMLLGHTIPVFIAGSILMTIDPPYFFFWALATCLAAKAIFDEKDWIWPFVGVALGLGFLSKYTCFVWWLTLIPFLIVDARSRRLLKSPWFWSMFPVALAFTTPVIVWNARHGWPTVKHVQADTSAGFSVMNLPEFLGGQAAILGLSVFFFVCGALWYVFREGRNDPHRRALYFLTSIGLTYFCIVGSTAFTTKVQPNWPACAYFTLLILATYFLSRRLPAGPHKWWWRGNVICGALIALILMPAVHDFSVLYPTIDRLLPRINSTLKVFGLKKEKTLRELDPTYKLRGWDLLGDQVGVYLKQMPEGTFVLAEGYQAASQVAFYTPGQPKTYVASSYFKPKAKRLSQYDIWQDRSLEPGKTSLLGRDAIYIGYKHPDIEAAFESIEKLPIVEVTVRGHTLTGFTLWRCRGFKGMERPAAAATF